MGLAVINDNIFLYLISALSFRFLYASFLVTFKNFLKKNISLRALFKEYNKFGQASVPFIIFFQMFFGIKFILGTLIKFKFVSLYQYPAECLLLVIGIFLIICVFKNVINFDS
jgi:hypothetical protein